MVALAVTNKPRLPRTNPAPISPAEIGRKGDTRRSVCLTKVAGRVVGWAALSLTDPDELTINRLSICPDFYHTHVVDELLGQIRTVCAVHRRTKILAAPGSMPGWLLRSLHHSGFFINDA